MKTELIQDISVATSLLKRGELVAIPTETVYGLAARVFDPAAIAKIYAVKGRPSDNPLIAHISDLEMGLMLTPAWTPEALLLANLFWPGPLTLILPKRAEVPMIASAGLETIGIRMPRHQQSLKIIAALGEPVVAPSANLSGRPSPTCTRDVLEDLDGRIGAVFEGGECDVGIESTILNLASAIPQILRPGSISREEIENALGMKIEMATSANRPIAPGMKYRHYAPKAKIELIQEAAQANGSYILRAPSSKTLYQSFREADRMGVPLISILIDPAVEKDEGLMNRIKKAAHE